MKKLFLTAVVALFTLGASAQFMVTTVYDSDQEENADKITAKLGFGYMVNDALTVGLSQATHEGHDHGDEDVYDLWVRYNLSMMDGAYASLQMPTEDGSDHMKVGIGIAFIILLS